MKSIIFFCLSLLLVTTVSAQFEFGIKGGLSTSLSKSENFFQDAVKSKSFWTKAQYGHHLGIYSRLKLASVYLEPSILFNSDKVTYMIDDYTEGKLFNTLIEDSYKSIDVPVVLGVKLGIFRVNGGVIGHIPIQSIKDVFDVTDYDVTFSRGKFAWLGGVGLDLWRLRMDVRYEGKFDSQKDYVSIGDQTYQFDHGNHMISATLGFKF
ncbi:MAG: outer membrane beta-barrel protein [Saprospiraceae bacterium]|nr:outer membrane beta-barrel protein [Saprospiraceae bacterium]